MTERGGWKMMQQLRMHQGPTDARDWTPHLSQPCSNCIVGSLLPDRCLSAAQTKLVLMKPSDEVAITDFCHCHRGQPWRRRGGGGGAGYLAPEGFCTPAALRWVAGRLSCCQRQLESRSWIRGLLWVIVGSEVKPRRVWRRLCVDGWFRDTSRLTWSGERKLTPTVRTLLVEHL